MLGNQESREALAKQCPRESESNPRRHEAWVLGETWSSERGKEKEDFEFLFFFSLFLKKFFYFNWRLITLQYCGFCHTFTWISHGCTCVPCPDPPSHLPPHPISQGHPGAPALSTLSHVSNPDWCSVSQIIYMFQCYYLKSSHPRLLPRSPKDSSIHLSLFCCLVHRVIVTIFLNCIYMR